MDIQKLKYFYTTAQLEHITRASEILHISQPSLTQAIQSLEFELGISHSLIRSQMKSNN